MALPLTWTMRALPTALQRNWSGVTFANGLFVAAASTGQVMFSPDGVNWTQASTAGIAGSTWNGIAYDGTRFIIVGTQRVAYSTNATSWTVVSSSPSSLNLNCVIYGGSTFVAGSVNNVLYTSPDLITWTMGMSTVINGRNWSGLAYYGGVFVACAPNWGAFSYSTNGGVTWAAVIYPSNAPNCVSVAYGAGLFVAVGTAASGSLTVSTSPDGATWTNRTGAGGSRQWTGVAYDGSSLFVAVCNNASGNATMTSPNGINWTINTAGTTGNATVWNALTYGNGRWVAVGNGVNVMTADYTPPPLSQGRTIIMP